MENQATMSELEVACNFLEFLEFSPEILPTSLPLSHSNGSRSSPPKICPIQHVPQFLMPGGAKLNSASAAGKCQALPRPVPVQCPHRLQCSEKPKAEGLSSDLFSWLCSSPSLLIIPSVDIVVGVVESQLWPEVRVINKMPFMKGFLPGTFNEECFALFYLSLMPRWEVCSSRAGVSSRSQRLSEVAFLKLSLLVTHKLVSCFQMRERDRGRMGK